MGCLSNRVVSVDTVAFICPGSWADRNGEKWYGSFPNRKGSSRKFLYFSTNEVTVQEKLGFRYQWMTEDTPVPQMGETRRGHVNLLTREDWSGMITACVPSFDDLWFRQTMMADPQTMS